MFLMRDMRVSVLRALSIILSSLSSTSGYIALTPGDCDFPPINFESQGIDVLGDYEKLQVCRLPRPESLCPRVGPADSPCLAIAHAVRGVSNVSCSHPHTCSFLVKSPVQHPHTPGFAYVTLCKPKFIGVIFPCRENNLVIANPFWRGVYLNEDAGEEEPGNIASNPHCDFPPLDFDAMPVDVLGDREKGNVCKLPRPAHLCERGKGPADEFCKKIARAVGGTSNASCFRKKTCTFHVKRPIQHPDEPGEAYVSLCVPDYAGVIWPCRENNLVIINPFYNTIDAEYGDELTQDAPNWVPLGIKQCGQIDKAVTNFQISSKKITKPQPTVRGQFPWQVALYRKHRSEGDEFFNPFCGASIITQNHILTAAHCLRDTDFKFKAIIGDFDRIKSEPLEQSFHFDVRDIYAHAQYNSVTEEHDIAIVRLKGTITLNMYAQPICLPAKSLPYMDKLDCLISGWGKTWDSTHADNSRTLAAARVATLNQNDCSREQAYGNRIKDTMFCAGSFMGGADSCQGDSGGPLVCDVQDEYNKHYLMQLGIVSFGTGCGKVNKPGVYTKLSKYQEWMDKTINDSIKNIAPIVQKKIGS